MDAFLPIEQMSTEDKLRAMEELWSANPADVPLPEWHGEVLRERQEHIDKGAARFSAWEDAKKRLRDCRP